MSSNKYDKNTINKYVNQARYNDGQTAYIQACKTGNIELVKTLIEICNVDVTIKSNEDKFGSEYVPMDDVAVGDKLKKYASMHERQRTSEMKRVETDLI